MDKIVTGQLSFRELTLPATSLYRYMGYKEQAPDPIMEELVSRFFAELCEEACPVYGYRIVTGRTEAQTLLLATEDSPTEVCFSPGRIIRKSLEGCSQYVILLSSVGAAFDAWMSGVHQHGDILEMYLADAIGSLVAERVSEEAYSRLAAMAAQAGLKLTNAYSPGYCDWHVSEQRALFSLLPSNFCGITLSDSCLMHPIKSISNVIGMDASARKRPYGCAICHRKDCFVRKSK